MKNEHVYAIINSLPINNQLARSSMKCARAKTVIANLRLQLKMTDCDSHRLITQKNGTQYTLLHAPVLRILDS